MLKARVTGGEDDKKGRFMLRISGGANGGVFRPLPDFQPPQVSLARIHVRIHFYMAKSCRLPVKAMPFWLAGKPQQFELPGKVSTVEI